MWKKLTTYIREEGKEIIKAAVVLCLVILAFAAYLKFVGLPMTRARNTYNEGMIQFMAGDISGAKQSFENSLSYWHTSEAENALTRTEQATLTKQPLKP